MHVYMMYPYIHTHTPIETIWYWHGGVCLNIHQKGKSFKKLGHCYGLKVCLPHKMPILKPNYAMVFGDCSFGRQLAYEIGGPVLGWMPLYEETGENLLPFFRPCLDRIRRWPSANEKKSSHQKPDLPTPYPLTSQPPNIGEINVC